MSQGNYDAFLAALRQRESGNNYQSLNELGFAGAYQMGKAALIEAGFVVHPNPGHAVKGNDWTTAQWTDKAKKLGVNCIADFLGAKAEKTGLPKYEDYYPMVFDKTLKKRVPGKVAKSRIALDPSKAAAAKEAQDEAAKAYDQAIWRHICAKRADTFVGTNINEVWLTPSGLIAGYHLGGLGYHTNRDKSCQGGLEAYLCTNGKEDGQDNNKTPISQYIALFNNYDVPFQKIHLGPAALAIPKPKTDKKKLVRNADNGLKHPHAAETSTWYQRDYYNTKHWNISSRLYHLFHHDGSNDEWTGWW